MQYLLDSLTAAVELLYSFDPDVLLTVSVSLGTSACSLLLASFFGVPCGTLLGTCRFYGRHLIVTLLNTMMALPTVVVGLLVFGLLSRQGPIGEFGLLFTPVAMVIGQTVLATPIVAHYTFAAVTGADQRILPTALTLGASPLQGRIRLLKEVRFGVIAAVVAAFGRVIAEVGVAMMLGGNIRGYTRTMTTAIALETSKGEFAFALALGIILLLVALAVNLFLNLLQQK